MKQGILGVRRLTRLGPFVSEATTRDTLAVVKDAIGEVGFVNSVTQHESVTSIDYFLGPESSDPLTRFNNGEYGGAALVDEYNGLVKGSTTRLGLVDDADDRDMFLVEAYLEQMLQSLDPPPGVVMDTGDFRQGVVHIRTKRTLAATEWADFFVRAVKTVQENFDSINAVSLENPNPPMEIVS